MTSWNDGWGYNLTAGYTNTVPPLGSAYNPISPLQTVRLAGWQCPGCNACYSPSVAACWHCQPQQTVTATGANTEPEADGECVPESEGGTCCGGRHCSC